MEIKTERKRPKAEKHTFEEDLIKLLVKHKLVHKKALIQSVKINARADRQPFIEVVQLPLWVNCAPKFKSRPGSIT